MIHTQAIDLILENIEKLDLPKINRLMFLENQEPTIYLCGKSSTGKTTFLNALFHMKRDELFTSTNISTKTEFRFQYGKDQFIRKSDEAIVNIPSDYVERKELFRSLNEEGNSYRIELNKEVLLKRTIVDIPGVLDFKRDNTFFNQMLDEADIVFFFTPCTGKISDSESKLLKSINSTGIPIIVLFTMGDITDVDEGITRKTIPGLVENRLSTCFKGIHVAHFQIISSNDFYKGKDTHGIDLLTNHIINHEKTYKQVAEKNKLDSALKYYKNLIQKKLDELNKDSENYRRSVSREFEIRYEKKLSELENKNERILRSFNSEMDLIKENCKSQIFNKLIQEHDPEQKPDDATSENRFRTNWGNFWKDLKEEYEFLEIPDLKIPPFPKGLFDPVTIKSDKLEELFGAVKKAKKIDNKENHVNSNLKKKQSESNENSTEPKQDIKKSSNGVVKEKPNIKKERSLSWSDYLNLAVEFGVNINNAKILWSKYSYMNKIETYLDEIKDDLYNQFDKEFQLESTELEKQNCKDLENKLSEDSTLNHRSQYVESLTELKSI